MIFHKKSVLTSFILLYILFNSQKGHTQVSETNTYWVDVEVGVFNNFKNTGGFSEGFNLNYAKKRFHYKLQYKQNYEFNIFGPLPHESLYSFNALMGKQVPLNNFFHAQFLAGIGVVSGTLRKDNIIEKGSGMLAIDTYASNKIITPALPIEIGLICKPLKNIMLGINLFGNINIKRPFYGMGVNLGFGKLK